MPSHRIQKDFQARRRAAVPFGFGQANVKSFREMVVIAGRTSVPEKGMGFRGVFVPSPF